MAKVNKQAKKHTGRSRKEVIIEEISAQLSTSKGIVLTDYKGLTHQQLENLKRELDASDSTFAVTKNTLLKLALEKSPMKDQVPDLGDALDNPTGTLFIKGDQILPLKALAKAIKEFGLPRIKVGIIDGSLLDEQSIVKLSQLPPKETLIAQFGALLNSPVQRLVYVLNANTQKLVIALDQIAKSKPTTPAAPAEVQPVEAAVEAAEPAVQPEPPIESLETPEVGPDEAKVEDNKGGEE